MEDTDPSEVLTDFYVYLHRDRVTKVPFYVGKGRGLRSSDPTHRSAEWREHVATLNGDYEVLIVHSGLIEKDAFLEEARLILQFGKRSEGTGTLVNRTDGGEDEMGAPFIEIRMPDLPEVVCRKLSRAERSEFAERLLASATRLLDAFVSTAGAEQDADLMVTHALVEAVYVEAKAFRGRRVPLADVAAALDSLLHRIDPARIGDAGVPATILAPTRQGCCELTALRESLRYHPPAKNRG